MPGGLASQDAGGERSRGARTAGSRARAGSRGWGPVGGLVVRREVAAIVAALPGRGALPLGAGTSLLNEPAPAVVRAGAARLGPMRAFSGVMKDTELEKL